MSVQICDDIVKQTLGWFPKIEIHTFGSEEKLTTLQ